MNIKRAKQEIKNAIAAYLEKDEKGRYRIPPVRQRPLLLIGPPGIGKTQIMEQAAAECSLALCAYTITHHTRQSAIGLPFILEREYGGEKKSITEYTMSEIIASIYERMEASGRKEGILFIDEINCASETLAPAMLQFLQGKTFGNQKVPEGWIIAAAGNPPEYNRSVREFDIVTLDRVKVMQVEADFDAWKEYAYEAGVHESILSYLNIHREYFYRVETTVDGKQFVTARGWHDLSEILFSYERLGLKADKELISQYLQHEKIARDFANYLELYYKYREDYRVGEILAGTIRPGILEKLKFAPFDERLKVVSGLLAGLSESFRDVYFEEKQIGSVYDEICKIRDQAEGDALFKLRERVHFLREEYEHKRKAGLNERDLFRDEGQVLETLEKYEREISAEHLKNEDVFPALAGRFNKDSEALEKKAEETSAMLEHAFDFMEAAFGESQEMVVFITELSVNRFAAAFIRENDCDRYYMYNKRLLFADREANVRGELDRIRGMMVGKE